MIPPSRLLLPLILLFLFGLLMIFDTTSAEVLDLQKDKSLYLQVTKQIFYAVLALGSGIFASKFGWERFLKHRKALLAASTLLLVLVLIPGIGKEVNGSKRWLQIASFSIQPSEFFKFILIGFFVGEVGKIGASSLSFSSYLKILLPLSLPIFLILLEPNNGTVFVLVVLLLALSFLTEIPTRFWAIPLTTAVVLGLISLSILPYARSRIETYLHPEKDIKGKGHQPFQAKIAAGSGGVMGRGPGKSLQKLSYLPEAQNDYIVAIFAEEWGFLGMIFLVGTYLSLFLISFQILVHLVETPPFLLGSGILFLISFQALLNLGVVSGLLPSTGLNLPFFSQGGSSLIANSFGIGILYDIGRARCVKKS